MQTFVIRRALRIFPPLAVAVLLLFCLEPAFGIHRAPIDYLYGFTLAGYFTVPQIVVVDVAWTLVIELLFYALIAALMPILTRRGPVVAVTLASAVPLLVIVLARSFGPSFFLFAGFDGVCADPVDRQRCLPAEGRWHEAVDRGCAGGRKPGCVRPRPARNPHPGSCRGTTPISLQLLTR